MNSKAPELLAPAGDIESGYAALHYGANAVYTGLRKFSARAEAANLSPAELGELANYAHSLTPRRNVYVTINTLINNDELPDLAETLNDALENNADAIIVQDLGVLDIARKYFPDLKLHASTQMAIHNLEGALTAKSFGFKRVTLARELTVDEIKDISSRSGIETEAFIHGALCYSYSGLCLYSALLRGKSGNRGRCSYPCRDRFNADNTTDKAQQFPFSMKDLALPSEIKMLKESGVTALKIEGRKKSALYVACTTSLYRKLLDGNASISEIAWIQEDIKTVFSRPWTSLYARSRDNHGICDTETVGHRGSPIGSIISVSRNGDVRFRTDRPLERHDGIQIDLPGEGKPYGFPVDSLFQLNNEKMLKGRSVFEVKAGTLVEIPLPAGYPQIPVGAPVYCSSSQSVKRSWKYDRPKPGAFMTRQPVDIILSAKEDRLTAKASSGPDNHAESYLECRLEPSRGNQSVAETARQAFEKTGDSIFRLNKFNLDNKAGLFIPVSLINKLRRDVISKLESTVIADKKKRIESIKQSLTARPAAHRDPTGRFHWIIKTDLLENIRDFKETDWEKISELTIDIGRIDAEKLLPAVDAISKVTGRDKLRFALPIITRTWEHSGLLNTMDALHKHGWTKWEASNLSAFDFLKKHNTDMTADWPLYVFNRCSAGKLLEMGVKRFTLAPEDSISNMTAIAGEYSEKAAIIIYQDCPLFISETCAHENITGRCAGKGKECGNSKETYLRSGKRENVILIQQGCRSVVINSKPMDISDKLDTLIEAGAGIFRIDLINRLVQPDGADIFREISRHFIS